MESSPEDSNKELATTPTDLNSEEIIADAVGEESSQTGDDIKSSSQNTGELENPTSTVDASSDGKINLFLKATSDVPIMKKKKWQVDENKTVHWVITFIKRYLKLEDKDNIFLYVSQAFAPAPDQQIKNLYECFGSEGKLVLHYSKTPAWG